MDQGREKDILVANFSDGIFTISLLIFQKGIYATVYHG